MRQRLKKKQEALADFFDFKIYIAFIFKDEKKGTALFEAADVVPIMANNYEDKIVKVGQRVARSLCRLCFDSNLKRRQNRGFVPDGFCPQPLFLLSPATPPSLTYPSSP